MKVSNILHIEMLKNQAIINLTKRSRICYHESLEDSIHEMLICLNKDTYIKPHQHINKIESGICIDGNAILYIFDDYGKVKEKYYLSSNFEEKSIFYYRLEDSIFHTIIVETDNFIFFEITQGPYKKEDTKFALWAPDTLEELKKRLLS
ncbi:MAG: WbuC family cupin fold metalloprotein [Chthoniobacterales bacterium]|nr:WbuC family cupin fold metalloprotein [Chthoniobacterales bacterium]